MLWYLDVHVSDPPRWIKTQASLFQTHIRLTWNTVDGKKGIVTLNLLECVDLQSMPTTSHPTMKEDVGSMAWYREGNCVEDLYPIHLVFSDGVERLACETLRERLVWAGAIW